MDPVPRNGHIRISGGNIARFLLNSGYRVRGSVRQSGKSDGIAGAMTSAGTDPDLLEVINLDLLKDEGWQDAIRDVRHVPP